jgi:hypothetical protein
MCSGIRIRRAGNSRFPGGPRLLRLRPACGPVCRPARSPRAALLAPRHEQVCGARGFRVSCVCAVCSPHESADPIAGIGKPRQNECGAQRLPLRSLTRSMYSHFKAAARPACTIDPPSPRLASHSPLSTRHCLPLPVTHRRVETHVTHTKQTTAHPSTRHSRQAPLCTGFRVSIFKFREPSPVHPCELKMAQLTENKERRSRQPGTLTIREGSSSRATNGSRGISPRCAFRAWCGPIDSRDRILPRNRSGQKRVAPPAGLVLIPS